MRWEHHVLCFYYLGVLLGILLWSMFTVLQNSILSPKSHSWARIQNWVCLTFHYIGIPWHIEGMSCWRAMHECLLTTTGCRCCRLVTASPCSCRQRQGRTCSLWVGEQTKRWGDDRSLHLGHPDKLGNATSEEGLGPKVVWMKTHHGSCHLSFQIKEDDLFYVM